MARNRTPQDQDYTNSKRIHRAECIIFVLSYLFSFAQMRYQLVDKKLFLVISAMLLLILFGFDKWREIFFDQGSNRKRRFFIDNSFGTVREPHANNSYYDNSEIKFGLTKLLANLHENVFMSMRILKKMFVPYFILSAILVLIWIYLISLSGMNDFNSLFLNFILSGGIVIRTINLNEMQKATEAIYDKANDLCSNYENNCDESATIPGIIDLLIGYENIINDNKIVLSEFYYSKLNKSVTEEWFRLKSGYRIYKS